MKFSLFSSTVSIYHFEPNTSIQIKKKKKKKKEYWRRIKADQQLKLSQDTK